MLRKAIEEDWSEPSAVKQETDRKQQRMKLEQREVASQIEQRKHAEQKKQAHQEWLNASPQVWQSCIQAALEQESNMIVRRNMQNKTIDDPPHAAFLIQLKKLNSHPGEQNNCSTNHAS